MRSIWLKKIIPRGVWCAGPGSKRLINLPTLVAARKQARPAKVPELLYFLPSAACTSPREGLGGRALNRFKSQVAPSSTGARPWQPPQSRSAEDRHGTLSYRQGQK